MNEIPIAGAPVAGDRPDAAAAPVLTPEMKEGLDALVQQHDLVLFMKGTPDAPQCGFSARAAEVLTRSGRPFHAVNVFEYGADPWTTVRALAEWADFPTLPQVWVKGELIGGSDIALDMYESGELTKMLDD